MFLQHQLLKKTILDAEMELADMTFGRPLHSETNNATSIEELLPIITRHAIEGQISIGKKHLDKIDVPS